MCNLDSQILSVNTANLTTNLQILEYHVKNYNEMKRQNDKIIQLLYEIYQKCYSETLLVEEIAKEITKNE